MLKRLFLTEQLTYSTTRIECKLADGSIATGTGFFYQLMKTPENSVPVIVTNKHVVAGAVEGRFWLTQKDANGDPVTGQHLTLVLDNFESRWLGHPDPDVDLCVMPIAPLLKQSEDAGCTFFFVGLDESLLPSSADLAELSALEEILMIGYPNGIWDSKNNQPILRRGVTATHPNIDYEGRPEFLIDAACFPGSSGSPVLLVNQAGWLTREGALVMGGTRVKLLGVLFAGPQHTTTGDVVVVKVPTQQRAIAVTAIPNNLGYVIKASRIAEIEAEFKRRTQMAA